MEIIDILHMLADAGLVRLGKVTGDWHTLHCPFHKDGQERKPSCGVLLRDQVRNRQRWQAGTFHCFTCGTVKTFREGVLYILQNYCKDLEFREKVLSFIDSEDLITEDLLVPKGMMEAVTNAFALDQLQELVHPQKQDYISEEELAGYRYTVPYMYERKLTDAIIEEYDVGVDMHWVPPGRKKEVPCLTFPVHDLQGNVLFIYRRSIEGKFFNAPEGVNKPVYGLHRVPSNCKSLLICESILNALTARTYNYNAVALLGTGNVFQIQQLRESGIREFVLCMDGDEAGRRAQAKLAKNLQQNAIIWTIHMPDGKDLNDCTKEEFDTLYSQKD